MNMLNKDWFLRRIYNGVRIVAYRHAVDQLQAHDFMQEGLIAAMHAIDRYKHKSTQDVIRLASRTAFNKIVDAQREAVRYHTRFASSTENVEAPVESHENEVEAKVFIEQLDRRLSALGKKILREKLAPSDRTLQMAMAVHQHKLKERAAGKLVMNINPTEIPDSLVAKSLDISKATMSRELKRIKEQAESLMQDRSTVLKVEEHEYRHWKGYRGLPRPDV